MTLPPYRIHSVEPVDVTSAEERRVALEDADFNPFGLSSRDVYMDLLTDSGTGAMSCNQWGELMKGDESYAGSRSFESFEEYVRDLTGYEHVFPVHQGRAAERILFSVLGEEGKMVPNNLHFDTTRANVEHTGTIPVDLLERNPAENEGDPFRGNMDVDELERLLSRNEVDRIPICLLTITNNSAAGLPVSWQNLKQVRSVTGDHGVPLYLDAARFAENAFWVWKFEKSSPFTTIGEIARAFFRESDGCLISAKKDGLGNIGGLLCTNSKDLAREIRKNLILTEGYPTYGGLAGRDLNALRVGLEEVLEEQYLEHRYEFSKYVGERLKEIGVPVLQPVALHAVYINAGKLLSHLEPGAFPGVSLVNQLYLTGGIRGVEIGTLMYGNEKDRVCDLELTRLCFPRRKYCREHVDHLVRTLEKIMDFKEDIPGMELVDDTGVLRHFSSKLKPRHPFPSEQIDDQAVHQV